MLRPYLSTTLVIGFVLLTVVFGATFVQLGKGKRLSFKPGEQIKREEPDFEIDTPFLNLMSMECPNDISVSDKFVCIADATNTLLAEIDALANKLIVESPKRFKELASAQDSSMSWEYGGELFLAELPVNVEAAQLARDAYINAVCKLDAVQIYGSSGMDLEREACRYYYARQYLKILRNLD